MIRRLLPLSLVFLTSGLSIALVSPFLSLFLSSDVDAGPVQVTAFLVLGPLAGVVVAWLVGRISDSGRSRRLLLIVASVAGVVAFAVTAVVRDYWVLLALNITVFSLAFTTFPQVFAYARVVLMRDDPSRAAMSMSALRTVFSIAWVAGPPLASVLLQVGGFRLVYSVGAVVYAICAVVALFLLPEVPSAPTAAGDDEPAGRTPWRMWVTAGAFVLMQAPLVLAVQALPLFLSIDLGVRAERAGLLLGLCAALEIPLMLGLGWLSTRMTLYHLILIGSVFGLLYYAIAGFAGNLWVLAAGQLPNALFIAAVSALGVTYMQDMLPSYPGRATTLFTNTFPIGSMLAGPLIGVAVKFGYWLAYPMSAVMIVAGIGLLVAGRERRPLPLIGASTGGADTAAGDRRPS